MDGRWNRWRVEQQVTRRTRTERDDAHASGDRARYARGPTRGSDSVVDFGESPEGNSRLSTARIGDSRSTKGLGGYAGAFCFRSGKDFQSEAKYASRRVAIEFLLDHRVSSVRLCRVHDISRNRSRHEIRDLQPGSVRRLWDEARF